MGRGVASALMLCALGGGLPASGVVPRKPMALVPAGPFVMGCDECRTDEAPRRMVRLDGFVVDESEVTVEQYGACVREGVCSRPAEEGSCNWGKAERGDHPINCVDWDQAAAFCAWAGKRLPSEAQWEKAARGHEGAIYPWGDAAPTCARAVFSAPTCPPKGTGPVAQKRGESPWGARDMAGNVWEWTTSLEPHHKGPLRVIKGGGWRGDGKLLRASNRAYAPPDKRGSALGFRCVAPLPPEV